MSEIGLALMTMGIAFFGFGMMLLFDAGLLALGNILFIFGLGLFIGVERIIRFFFQRHKLKGTSFFLGGIFAVLFGFPLIGTIIELYGSFCLFGGFMPVVIQFLYNVPVIGWILYLPIINRAAVALSGQSKSMV
ncbi:Vesicle transport protein GOT1B [Taenia crassiceps]|uniref:Vesicle transport protein GOT1B n=1 Tax=Taenia crassiceps TaxID=6207 RepID=A0ABR4QLY7_9CEST